MKVDMMMDEQFGATPTAHGPGPRGHDPQSAAVRPTESSPAEISQSRQQGAAMDGELSAIHNKLNRIMGKSEWNAKQFNAACALMAAYQDIVNPGWPDKLAQVFKEFEEKNK
jgi:hypothetical protein